MKIVKTICMSIKDPFKEREEYEKLLNNCSYHEQYLQTQGQFPQTQEKAHASAKF